MGGVLLIITGFCWFLYKVIADSCVSQAPFGTDYDKVYRDLRVKKVDAKTVDRRISNGYYVKNSEK